MAEIVSKLVVAPGARWLDRSLGAKYAYRLATDPPALTIFLYRLRRRVGVLDRLKAMLGPGEGYSDVIIRVARG
jgi:hypothetical protein